MVLPVFHRVLRLMRLPGCSCAYVRLTERSTRETTGSFRGPAVSLVMREYRLLQVSRGDEPFVELPLAVGLAGSRVS